MNLKQVTICYSENVKIEILVLDYIWVFFVTLLTHLTIRQVSFLCYLQLAPVGRHPSQFAFSVLISNKGLFGVDSGSKIIHASIS